MDGNARELAELQRRVDLLEQALLSFSGASSVEQLLSAALSAPDSSSPSAPPKQSLPGQSPPESSPAVQSPPGPKTTPQESRPAELQTVTKDSSPQDKIALFLDYFSGRPDICATAWENQSTGRKGWMPLTKGASFKKNPAIANRVPLSTAVVEKHLRSTNSFHAGLYPMFDDDTTKLLVCDFDDDSFQADATAYARAASAHGLNPLIEVSRSGKGAHVWLFFTTPVPAKLARQVGMGLLNAATTGAPVTTTNRTIPAPSTISKAFASFDRFIPAQDLLPSAANGSARLGNLIALPLAGHHRVGNTTVFVDDSFAPFADQFAALAQTDKSTLSQLTELKSTLYANVGDVEIPPGPRKVELKAVAKSNAGKEIRVTHGAQVRIPTDDLDATTLRALTRLGVFANPSFYISQARRHSTWNIPRVIVRFTHSDDVLSLDRGTLDAAIDTLKTAGYTVSRRSLTSKPPAVHFTFTGKLLPEQEKAATAILAKPYGTLIAPPGAGKTVIALYLMAQRGVPTAIIVNTKELVNQWHAAIEKFLSPTTVGQYGAGKTKPSFNVDIVSAQSISRKDSRTEFLRKYGYVIVDECHSVGAPGLASTLSDLNVRFFTGLTATPMRSDGLDPIIPLICGPIRHEMQLKRSITKRYVVHEIDFESDLSGPVDMTALYNELASDPARNDLIAGQALTAFNRGETVLILVNRRAHIDVLHQLITQAATSQSPSGTPLILTLHGGQSPKERAAVREQLTDAEHFILIAMNKVAGEGIDLPSLDTLLLASPVSFKGNIIQQVGRITRTQTPHPSDTSSDATSDDMAGDTPHVAKDSGPASAKSPIPPTATVHDFYDLRVPALNNMFVKRRAIIRKEGFVQEK